MRSVGETRYAKDGEVSIAYQVMGSGELDLVYVSGWLAHLEVDMEFPRYAAFAERLASFARLVRFDKRGAGMSDREVGTPTWPDRVDDLRVVMDAVGCDRAALFGLSEGGPIASLFASMYPERTSALILCNTA